MRKTLDEFSAQEIRERWDEIAEVRKGRDATNAFVVEAAWKYLKEGAEILDIGPGTGKYVVALAAKGIKVTPLDFSKKVHEVIKGETGEFGLKREQMIADAVNLPYKDESLDGAIFFRTSAFLRREDVGKCLLEIERVLKPGGILIASFPSTESDLYKLSQKPFENSKTVRLLGFEKEGLTDLPRNFFDRRDFEEYKKLIEINFTVKKWEHEETHVIFEGQLMNIADWCITAEKKKD